MRKHITQAALTLSLCAITGTALVATSYQLTQAQIIENERQQLLERLNVLVPAEQYNNDLYNDTLQVTDSQLLGTTEPLTVYRAWLDDQPVAAVFNSVAPDGYNGIIRLLIGIDAQGQVIGVRVYVHQETPGLGDKIEVQRSAWILQFDQRSLQNLPIEQWQVKKDGGQFDQLTSATITSRAIVKAVRKTVQFFNQHQQQIFNNNNDQ